LYGWRHARTCAPDANTAKDLRKVQD